LPQTLEATTFEDGQGKIRFGFKLKTPEARDVLNEIEMRQQIIRNDRTCRSLGGLMRFTRSAIGDVTVGKPSGEMVRIDEISDRPLALVLCVGIGRRKDQAHEIRDADGNVYKKGFVVDANVKFMGGRSVAYAVTNFHEVIELPD
jgi:hypothetical protein